jgi:tetratricopeptide (TPR) repeat protein
MKTQLKFYTAFFALFLAAGISAQTLADARKLTDNEQYEKARAAFKNLIVNEPTNGDNFFYFGDLMLKMEDPDSAKILFQKGLDINQTNPLTHVGMARYYMYTGNDPKGPQEIAYAKSLVTTQAGKKGLDMAAARQVQIDLAIAETETWASTPNYGDAIDMTVAAEKLDAKNPDVFLIRGDALYRKDPVNGTPAITAYNQAARLDPKSCKANVRIGQLYMNGKNIPTAISFYNVALKTDSTFAPAWRLKAEAQYQAQHFDSAQKSMATYLRLNDGRYARYRNVVFLYKSGDYNDAITEGTKALAKDSSITVIYRIVARSYNETKSTDPAKTLENSNNSILYFNKFFAKQKISGAPAIIPDDYIGRGKAYSKGGKDSLAIQDYLTALSIDTSRKDIYYDMATSYYIMKKYDKAAEYYKKKIDTNPKMANISDWNAYGRALYLQKDYVNADTAFRRVTLMDPLNPVGWYWRGRTNQAADPLIKSDSTRSFYETYFDLASKDKDKNKKELIVASKYLAGYHYIKKNFACSKAYFQYALDLDPANAEVKKQLETDKDIKAATAADITTCRMSTGK